MAAAEDGGAGGEQACDDIMAQARAAEGAGGEGGLVGAVLERGANEGEDGEGCDGGEWGWGVAQEGGEDFGEEEGLRDGGQDAAGAEGDHGKGLTAARARLLLCPGPGGLLGVLHSGP